jgi:hypothetical protein
MRKRALAQQSAFIDDFTPLAAAICATVVLAMPRSANNATATSSRCSRASKSCG